METVIIFAKLGSTKLQVEALPSIQTLSNFWLLF